MNENFEADVIVNSTVFEDNWGVYGGALSFYDSNVLVTNCTFTNNTVRARVSNRCAGMCSKSLIAVYRCLLNARSQTRTVAPSSCRLTWQRGAMELCL